MKSHLGSDIYSREIEEEGRSARFASQGRLALQERLCDKEGKCGRVSKAEASKRNMMVSKRQLGFQTFKKESLKSCCLMFWGEWEPNPTIWCRRFLLQGLARENEMRRKYFLCFYTHSLIIRSQELNNPKENS
jgi:hypothetical protein